MRVASVPGKQEFAPPQVGDVSNCLIVPPVSELLRPFKPNGSPGANVSELLASETPVTQSTVLFEPFFNRMRSPVETVIPPVVRLMQLVSNVTVTVVPLNTTEPFGHLVGLFTGRLSSFSVLSSYSMVISSVIPLGSGFEAVPAVESGEVSAGPRLFPGSIAGSVALQLGKVVVPPNMGRLIAGVVAQPEELGVKGM